MRYLIGVLAGLLRRKGSIGDAGKPHITLMPDIAGILNCRTPPGNYGQIP